MLGDQFQQVPKADQQQQQQQQQHLTLNSGLCLGPTATHNMPSCFEAHHQVTALSLVATEPEGHHHHHHHLISPPQVAYQNSHAIRYYPPLMEPPYHSLNRYSTLNQKRESVITFNANSVNHSSLKSVFIDSVDLEEDKSRNGSPPHQSSHHNGSSETSGGGGDNGSKVILSKYSTTDGNKSGNQVTIEGIPFTIEQVVCICQVLQKCDLNKLEKFIYHLPVDNKLTKNELILRARAIASYHAGNYREVYDILESNNFSVKYHQELQNLWNNAHYKEHELKRGHPPGAVEKYRIRKKFQFPRTIWDGEEYVYCFKEKNRRILKEFYQKCNLPTQEDKLKLSNQTQLTVVQISNWFKNRRQRDRQPNHDHDHDKTSSDAHSNVTNDSSSVATPSPPIITSMSIATNNNAVSGSQSFAVSESVVAAAAVASHHQQQHGQQGQMSGANNNSEENGFYVLGGQLSNHSQPPNAHRAYYFLPQ